MAPATPAVGLTASSCRACGGTLTPWREVTAGEPADPRRFELLRCEDCGSAVTAGEPPDPAAYETGVYAPGPPRALPIVRALQAATGGQPIRMLRNAGLRRGSRVLDAGAGPGRLVEALAEAGYAAEGIEPSARSAALARESGRAVRREHIQDHGDEGLDAVVLWHVLEHLEDPRAALEHVRGWLRPGGLVLVAVPNIDSDQARIGGPGWLHLDVPRHRSHFTPEGLEALIGRSGLESLRTHHAVWEHNPGGMWMALLTRAGMAPGLPFHLLKRNARARPRDLTLLAAGIPLVPVAVTMELFAAASRHGGTIAAVAARP